MRRASRIAAGLLVAALLADPASAAYPQWTDLTNGALQGKTSGAFWSGGTGHFYVNGTFGSATVTLFTCNNVDGAQTCFQLESTDCTFTAAGGCAFFAAPCELRITVTGGTGEEIDALATGPTKAGLTGGSGSVGFDAITAGTNAAALVVGTSGSMIISGTGTIAASSINADGDANDEIGIAASRVELDLNDDGSSNLSIQHHPSRVRLTSFAAIRLEPSSTNVATWSTTGLTVEPGLRIGFPVSATAPSSPSLGDTYFDSTNGTLCVETGAGFVQTDDYTTACT